MEKIRINNFKEHLYYEKLDNGLRIFMLPITNKKSFSAALVTKYGGRDLEFKIDGKEHKTPTGIAHFLEHKMFEREEDPFTFYNKTGTSVNAVTSEEYTSYYFMGNKSFKKNLAYLLNWIQSLHIDQDKVKKEQGIILEEASMYKDNPSRVLFTKLRENLYKEDGIKNKVIGTDEDIVSITLDELNLCYDSFYSPNNMFLIVTGNIKPKEVLSIVKENTKNWMNKNKKIEKIRREEPDAVNKEYDEISMNIGTPKVAVAYKINKDLFRDLKLDPFKLDLYLHSLINISLGTSSDTRQKWLDENLFTSATYKISEIESHYTIEFYANTNKENELINNLEKYIVDLKIDEESFERAKKGWIANEIKDLDDDRAALYYVLDDILDYDKFIHNKAELIKTSTFDELLKVKDCLSFINKSILKIVPKEK